MAAKEEVGRMRFCCKNGKIIQRTLGQVFIARMSCRQIFVITVLSCLCLLLVCVGGKGVAGKEYRHDLLSVSFSSEQNGWVCGRWGTILHTADGGKTWVQQASGTINMLTSISFVDEKTGWAVGERGTILHTVDGGKTWTKQKSPVNLILMGVCFVSPQRGWAVGEMTTIIHTTDGGKNWHVQFKDVDYILRSVSFVNEQNGWACGEYGYIYHTNDGGAAWTKQAGSFTLSEETGEIVAEDYLFQIRAINRLTAWAVGIDGLVKKTVDGGKNWKRLDTKLQKTHLFVVTHEGDRVVIGGTALLASGSEKDGRFMAARADPPLTYGWINSACPRGKAGFASVGKAGWIYLSNDTGTVWNRVEY